MEHFTFSKLVSLGKKIETLLAALPGVIKRIERSPDYSLVLEIF